MSQLIIMSQSTEVPQTEEMDILYQKIAESGKVAVAEAIARHRKLGEAIAIWQDGKVVVLNADEIPEPEKGGGYHTK